ncbi:cytochrome c oxidase subunit 7A COX9 [Phycomyces blakesleeanus NRRL 1555(-)]|uniref:Cytochrome c oxidase subunit 7A COX9 n=1 Tax=Phycomyces blakesleeanus (strain ATCC 8743b / DSM 1359 / FGSC 10004 / NBRC 33097 / NRRL 1555) TaxID=763407 RepID=A0A163AM42_PHYB8|nr:cytochrome c oxidase subunit 7A COX9 [Phycomyces blakesleeanus NRRL 1555(-)]OAD74441.1 cytochrome c oxidase subunit 7A COX9 [Phycomyces blakesleeanus NRRL 1555(-)]|eukprot:XP_018292481.1 cytochrome c oxidase subunit 7A COX9 [Phycomyces blakesleeanus NRRL 1555(-)]
MSLVNRPNTILAKQQYFQAPSNTLLFLRGPRDKVIVYTTFLVLGTGLLGSVWGAVKMARAVQICLGSGLTTALHKPKTPTFNQMSKHYVYLPHHRRFHSKTLTLNESCSPHPEVYLIIYLSNCLPRFFKTPVKFSSILQQKSMPRNIYVTLTHKTT